MRAKPLCWCIVMALEQGLDPAQVADALGRLRSKSPRVHTITNAVAQGFTANVLLALGAVPSMTIAADEVAQFVSGADALLINLGTLDEARREAVPLAMAAASHARKPVVLDPVFVDRSPVRCAFAKNLLAHEPTLLRANGSELQALVNSDNPSALQDVAEATTLALTGPEDLVAGQGRSIRLANGHPLLARVTATGCAGGAVLAAFSSVEPDPVLAAAFGLSVFNIAGEIAATRANGPGTLVPELLDALYQLDEHAISARLKLA